LTQTKKPTKPTKPAHKMKTTNIKINDISIDLELLAIERDPETNGAWRNGIAVLRDGTRIDCGGGWIEGVESANNKNEELGIAGGLRQGVRYPNEVVEGDFSPYRFGEDESGWEEKLMPVIYGSNWQNREDADEEVRSVHAAIQEALASIAHVEN
jgi:hypothetical protein